MTFVTRHEKERSIGATTGKASRSWEDEHIRYFAHANKQILLVDFSNCSAAQVERISRAVPDHVTKQPLGSVLLLANFAGAAVDGAAIRTMKESAVFDKPYIKKSAWIGAENFPREFYEELKAFARRELPIFGTRTDAVNWLVNG